MRSIIKDIERVGKIATQHDSFSLSKVRDNGDKTYTLELKKMFGKFEQAFYYRVSLMLDNLFERYEEEGKHITLQRVNEDKLTINKIEITYKEIN